LPTQEFIWLQIIFIKNVILIGYDLLKENIKFLENDTIQFLICQKPEEQGYKSVLSLFNYLLLNMPIEKFNYSPIDIIMKENIEYYKNFKI
jgi:LacI family transcriptional regulator